jgi:hypothetical protein
MDTPTQTARASLGNSWNLIAILLSAQVTTHIAI